MAITTRKVLRAQLSRAIGDFHDSVTDSGGSSTTLVDSILANFFTIDNAVSGWWVMITSLGADGEIKRIKSYTASAGTITTETAFSITIATATTYELHRIHPDDKHEMLNNAAETLFPRLYVPLRDETIVVNSAVRNPGFDTFPAGAFTSWTNIGTPSVSQETNIVFHGFSSAKIVATGAEEGLYQEFGTPGQYHPANVKEVVGKTIIYRCWVLALVASTARIGLSFDGTTYTYSDYHPGGESWRRLELTMTVPAGWVDIRNSVLVADGGTGYFDFTSLIIDPLERYLLPTEFRRTPHRVMVQSVEDDPNGHYSPLSGWPPEGHILRVEGQGVLSTTSVDTGTVEISNEHVNLLVQQAKFELAEMLYARTQDNLYLTWADQAQLRLAGMSSLRMAKMVREDTESWYVDEDSNGKVLVLTGKP